MTPTFMDEKNSLLCEFCEVNLLQNSDDLLYCASSFLSQSRGSAMLYFVEHKKGNYILCAHGITSGVVGKNGEPYPAEEKRFVLLFPIICLAPYNKKWTPRIALPPDTREEYFPLTKVQSGSLQQFFVGLIEGCKNNQKVK